MTGSLGRDRASVQLAREPDREVADVDHLLHLAEAFLRDLPDLERHEGTERLLLAAELLAQEAHELPAPRRRYLAPRLECTAARETEASAPAASVRLTRAISSPVMGVRTTRSPSVTSERPTPSRSSSARTSVSNAVDVTQPV